MRTKLALALSTLLVVVVSSSILALLLQATTRASNVHTSQDDVRAIRLHPATIRRPSPAPVPNDTYTEPTPPSTPLTYRSDDEPYSLPASDSRLAYVILGSGTRDAMLVALLEALRDRILPWTPGDVLFFHTGDYDHPAKLSLVTETIPDVQIHRIPPSAWKLPKELSEDDAPSWKYSKCCPFPMHGVGYRHMCRWYSNGLFKYLGDLGYDWVFRLDEDSELYTDVRQNMVQWMEAHGKQYAFRLWDWEDADMIWSLPELTSYYLTSREIRPAWLYDACRPHDSVGLNSHGGWNRRIIYNNMFMANVSWWLTEEVQSYLAEVERSNGFYLFRWGDAPVHTMVVRTFLQRPQVHMFGFGYCHKGNCDGARTYFQPALQDSPP